MTLRIFERIFVWVFFLYQLGVFTILFYPTFRAEDFASVQGVVHWPIAITQAVVCGLGSCLILMRWQRVLKATIQTWPLTILILLSPISALWSVTPDLTLRRSILQVTMFLLGTYLGERYSIEFLTETLVKVMICTMLVSVVLFVVARYYVIDPDQGTAWRGLADNKNAFGLQTSMALVMTMLVSFKRYDKIRFLMMAFIAGLLLLSHSMTSAVTAVVVAAIIPVMNTFRWSKREKFVAQITTISALIFIAVAISAFKKEIFHYIGRNETLTGRTEVWDALKVAISHKPILGYGFASFWTGLRGESLDVIVASGWLVPEAHNGYLEILVAFGWVGFLVFAVAIIIAIKKSIKLIENETGRIVFWPIAFYAFFLIHNFGESDLANNGSTLMITIFTIISTAVTIRTANKNAHKTNRVLAITR